MMHLQLITLTGVSIDKDVYELMAPTTAGDIAVFPGHEPLVTMAAPGVLAVRTNKEDKDEKLEYFAVSGGIIEINPKYVRVLVDEADAGDDITEAESTAALNRAMKMRDSATSQVDIEKAVQLITQSQVRLRVADLQRRRRRS
jgi:F-type H+-transporting ATPase subunit epsilon